MHTFSHLHTPLHVFAHLNTPSHTPQPTQDVVKAFGQQEGIPDLHVTGFVRLQCGEGLERKESNFAEEVAAAAGL